MSKSTFFTVLEEGMQKMIDAEEFVETLSDVLLSRDDLSCKIQMEEINSEDGKGFKAVMSIIAEDGQHKFYFEVPFTPIRDRMTKEEIEEADDMLQGED
jgi:hypothetical protein